MHQSTMLCRIITLLGGLVASGAVAAHQGAPSVLATAHRLDGERATADVQLTSGLVLLGAAGVLLAWSWLVLCTLVALRDVLDQRRGLPGRTTGAFRPVLLRSLLGIACLGAGPLVTPAHADEVPPVQDRVGHPGHHQVRLALLDGLLLPERVTDHGPVPRLLAHRARTDAPRPHERDDRDEPRLCRVTPGDSLWSLAEQLLVQRGEPAGAAAVDRGWHLLHRANRALLGDDPDLIRPGTVLRVPAPLATQTLAPTGDAR